MTHGASAYVNHRCRCAVCTAANSARVREYRKRRTAKGSSGRNGTTLGTTQIGPRDASTSEGRGPEPYGGPERA